MSLATESLRQTAIDCELSEVEAMNILQDHGVISDLCVWMSQVADADTEAAKHFLINHYETTRKQDTR